MYAQMAQKPWRGNVQARKPKETLSRRNAASVFRHVGIRSRHHATISAFPRGIRSWRKPRVKNKKKRKTRIELKNDQWKTTQPPDTLAVLSGISAALLQHRGKDTVGGPVQTWLYVSRDYYHGADAFCLLSGLRI